MRRWANIVIYYSIKTTDQLCLSEVVYFYFFAVFNLIWQELCSHKQYIQMETQDLVTKALHQTQDFSVNFFGGGVCTLYVDVMIRKQLVFDTQVKNQIFFLASEMSLRK